MKTVILSAKNTKILSIDLFVRVLEEMGHKVELSEKPQQGDFSINRLFGMDYDDSDLDAIEALKIPTLNSIFSQRICRDKWLSHQWLLGMGIKGASTFPVSIIEQGQGSLETLDGEGWYLKTIRGMQGRGVTRFNTLNELKAFYQDLRDPNYIIQKEVGSKHSSPVEVRSYHIGEEVFWFEKNGGNLAQGGSFEEVSEEASEQASEQIPALDMRLAKRIQAALGFSLGAIDYILDADELVPIDMNVYPGVVMVSDKIDSFRRMFSNALK